MSRDVWDDLIAGADEWGGQLFDDDSTPPPPTDDIGADRLLRRRRRSQIEVDRIHERFDGEIDRITRIRDDLLAGEQRQIEFIDAAMESYGAALRASGVKSRVLPNGKIRTVSRTVTRYDNEDATLLWLDANIPEFVRVKKTIDKRAIGAALKDDTSPLRREGSRVLIVETGEMLADVQIVADQISVSIE